MSEAAVEAVKRRSRMAFVYAGLLGILAVVGLTCWKWYFIQERWYCYRYERTQDPEYLRKLTRLGEHHPELPMSRWFFLTSLDEDGVRPDPLRSLFPLAVRQKALRWWLTERLKGEWWTERDLCVGHFRVYPGPCGPDDWMPSADVLKDAMRRVTKPPSSTGRAILEFYEVCLGLAYCGDDSVLPVLEDQMLNGTGCYPDDPNAITVCGQGPKGVVALAAHGNLRAREALSKGLASDRARYLVASEIARTLEQEAGYRPENLRWLQARLAEFEKQRALNSGLQAPEMNGEEPPK